MHFLKYANVNEGVVRYLDIFRCPALLLSVVDTKILPVLEDLSSNVSYEFYVEGGSVHVKFIHANTHILY